jgi:hypothetical protein
MTRVGAAGHAAILSFLIRYGDPRVGEPLSCAWQRFMDTDVSDRDIAELFYVQTDKLIARGTVEEVEKVLAHLLREAAQEGTDGP